MWVDGDDPANGHAGEGDLGAGLEAGDADGGGEADGVIVLAAQAAEHIAEHDGDGDGQDQ